MPILRKVATPGDNARTLLERLFYAWERCLWISLGLSVVLIGVGRIETPFLNISLSAWSTSRTTFFFWFIGRLFFYGSARRPWNLSWPECRPLLLFLGAILVSLVPRFSDLSDFRYLCFAVAHGLMVLDLGRGYKEQRLLILALGLVPALVLLRGLYGNPLLFDFALNHRLQYPLDHANTAGHLLAMSLPLAAVILITERGRLRAVAGLGGIAQLMALLLTYSRGAWLGFAGALAFLLAAIGGRREFYILLLLAAVLLLTIGPLRQRVFGIFDLGKDQAIADRMVRMRDTLRVGAANPVLGVGYGRGRLKAAIRANPASETSVNEPIWHGHNLYLELFAGAGIIGLGAYLWLVAKALGATWHAVRRATSEHRNWALGLAASAVAMLLCGLGDVTFHHHETRLFGFTLLALMLLGNVKSPSSASKSGEFPAS